MDNPLEISARRRVGKDDLGKVCAIELAVGKNLRAKSFDDRGQPRRARFDDLTSQDVGVDDDCTARRQLGGHQTFSRRDAAGQADAYHAQSLFRLGLRPSA